MILPPKQFWPQQELGKELVPFFAHLGTNMRFAMIRQAHLCDRELSVQYEHSEIEDRTSTSR